MYSILVKLGNNSFAYVIDDATNNPYVGDVDEVKAKLLELLNTNPLSKLIVVHNTTITNNLVIEDVAD